MKPRLLRARGTDLVMASLQCDKWFSLKELAPKFFRRRLSYGESPPISWEAGMRNELQELSSDAKSFQETFDLFARKPFDKGMWSIRDSVRAELILARNNIDPQQKSQLLIPEQHIWPSAPDAAIIHFNHSDVIGRWAQEVLMQEMQRQNYVIERNTALGYAFDFEFRERNNRRATIQIMECKGTTKEHSESFSLTRNEALVMCQDYNRYWLGHVCNIRLSDGVASGGSICIYKPPIGEFFQFGALTIRSLRKVEHYETIPCG